MGALDLDVLPVPLADAAARVDLDLPALQRSGLLVPSMDGTRLADEFRQLKRKLLARAYLPAPDRDGAATRRNALIMVTSALPSEGKTYCAINLAMSIAMEIDSSVLLVDADVLKPSLPSRLGLPEAAPGLLDLLADPRLPPSEVLLRTNVPKLSLLPAGTPSPRSAELLASAATTRLLAELAGRYPDRIVVLDAPPVLMTADAQTLASQVGQVVMVVEASRTPRQAALQAFAALSACPNVVSILNKTERVARAREADYFKVKGKPGR